MSGLKTSYSANSDVSEVGRAAKNQVRAAALVCLLLVALAAGSAGEEEPTLQGVAPCRGLMDKIS